MSGVAKHLYVQGAEQSHGKLLLLQKSSALACERAASAGHPRCCRIPYLQRSGPVHNPNKHCKGHDQWVFPKSTLQTSRMKQ